MGAGEQHLQLIGLDFAVELGQLGVGLGLDRILARLRLGLAQFQQHPQIVGPPAELDQQFGLLLQSVGLLDDLLGRFLVAPEGVGSHLRLVFGQPLGGLGQVDEPAQLSELGRDGVQLGPGDFEHDGAA